MATLPVCHGACPVQPTPPGSTETLSDTVTVIIKVKLMLHSSRALSTVSPPIHLGICCWVAGGTNPTEACPSNLSNLIIPQTDCHSLSPSLLHFCSNRHRKFLDLVRNFWCLLWWRIAFFVQERRKRRGKGRVPLTETTQSLSTTTPPDPSSSSETSLPNNVRSLRLPTVPSSHPHAIPSSTSRVYGLN